MTVFPSRLRPVFRTLGVLAVLLALAGRLAAGMVMADAEQGRDMAALLDAMVECQPDAPASPGTPGPADHRAGHAICALASVTDLPPPPLAPSAVVPLRPGPIPMLLAGTAPVRTSPAHPPGAALPRGPPVLT